jgi:hypothetical protein
MNSKDSSFVFDDFPIHLQEPPEDPWAVEGTLPMEKPAAPTPTVKAAPVEPVQLDSSSRFQVTVPGVAGRKFGTNILDVPAHELPKVATWLEQNWDSIVLINEYINMQNGTTPEPATRPAAGSFDEAVADSGITGQATTSSSLMADNLIAVDREGKNGHYQILFPSPSFLSQRDFCARATALASDELRIEENLLIAFDNRVKLQEAGNKGFQPAVVKFNKETPQSVLDVLTYQYNGKDVTYALGHIVWDAKSNELKFKASKEYTAKVMDIANAFRNLA